VKYVAGGKYGKSLTLSSIAFAVRATPGTLLDPAPGWTHYGKEYQDAIVYTEKGITILSGFLQRADNSEVQRLPNTLLTLPADAAPDSRLTFHVNNQGENHRVDVLQNGTVMWMSSNDFTVKFLSLDGVVFTRKPWMIVSLVRRV